MTTVVSLREITEATFRALTTHGASAGEASTAGRMVLAAELAGGGGLTAVLEDLARAAWRPTPVEITPLTDVSDARVVVLGSATANRLLREGPLAVELVTGEGQLDAAGLPGAVGADALLDPVLLEIARAARQDIAVVLCTEAPGTTELSAHVRWGRPDGSMGVATLEAVPPLCHRVLAGPGVLAVRDIGLLGGVEPSWIRPADRADVRARAAADGIAVDTGTWQDVRTAARRYLVPD